MSFEEVGICCSVRLSRSVCGWGALVQGIVWPIISNIHPKRNDTWVVPYNILFPMGYALYRGVTRRERPACRSVPIIN